MRPPLPRLILALVSLASPAFLLQAAAAADRAPAQGRPGFSVAVRPGESWESVRGRMFPVQSLKQANPGLDPDLLHPGQIVAAPYVRASELAREHSAREDAERRVTDARDRLAVLEREQASFASQRRAFTSAGDAMRTLRSLLLGLVAFSVLLLGGLGVAVQAALAARRRAAESESRRRDFESRHESLRRSLVEIESGLQRRMMDLLHLHGGKIISERELDASVRPVIHLAGEIRKKHGRA